MSSPISFSGFNNIDFNTIINAMMQEASQPLADLQTQQSSLQSQSTNFSTLSSRTAAVQSAASAIADAGTVSGLSATSSDASTVISSASTSAMPGHYDIVVADLARAQVSASTTTVADVNTTIVAKSGTLTIGGKDVTIGAGGVTLQGLADAINGTDGITVNASIVQTDANAYRLVLTSTSTGRAGGFSIDGTHLVDGDTAAVHFGSTNAVDAKDADVFVNNIEIKSSTNTLDGLIPGVTLTVLKKTAAGESIGVDVAADPSALKSKLQTFVNAYNALQSFATSQASAAGKGDTTSIGHDALLRGLSQSLRASLSKSYGSGGAALQYLAQVGVQFTQSGTLQLDDTTWNAAVSDSPEAVTKLLAGDGTTGAFAQISTLLTDYTKGSGLLTAAQTRLTDSVARVGKQIDAMTDRLTAQRTALQQEFTAADLAMSDLKNQSGSLANFSTNLTAAM